MSKFLYKRYEEGDCEAGSYAASIDIALEADANMEEEGS